MFNELRPRTSRFNFQKRFHFQSFVIWEWLDLWTSCQENPHSKWWKNS